MRKLILLLLFILIGYSSINSQTTLNPGEILFVGFNSDTPKQLAFVLLVEIDTGTTIYITDSGWLSDNSGFRANEGGISFTASKAYSAFDVIICPDLSSPSDEWAAVSDDFVGKNGINPSTSGDQFLAFQGSTENPTFIAAIQFNGSSWDANATSSNTSALPQGLNSTTNAIAVGNNDNGRYDGGVDATVIGLSAKVMNVANWTTSGSWLDLTTIPNPLPVELTSFSALAQSSTVNLTWETATEVNNYGFEIERTITNSKLQIPNWENVGFVEGHGNSNSAKQYSYVDNSVRAGQSYSYRLKQIDFDGQFEYSNIVNVEVGVPMEFSLAQNYPNPFNPSTSIEYSVPSNEFVTLKVYDVLGNTVSTLVNENKEVGKYNVSFDASNLTSGIYFYSINAGGFTQVKKMMLVK